jgi:transposase
VLGMLVKIFRGDGVAANRSLARKGDVALKNLVGAAADSYVGTVAVEGMIALKGPLRLRLRLVPVVAPTRRVLT